VARGISWTGAAQAADHLVTLAALALLARLLSPADFGTQALAATVIGLVLMVGDLGLGAALIQAPALQQADVRRASIFCAGAGLVWGGLAFAFSAWISRAFQGGEEVRDLIRVLSLCALLHPAGAVPRALMTRGLNFRRLALIDAAAALISAAASVGLALRGAGAQSLAWGYVVRVALSSGLAWIALPRSPHSKAFTAENAENAERGGGEVPLSLLPPFLLSGRRDGPGLLRFGLNATGAGLLNYLSASVDYLLVWLYLGPTALGLYYLAYQLVSFVHFRGVSILLRVLLPAFSAIQDDPERLRRAYLRAVRGIALFAFPILALLGALAREAVPVFYGPGKGPAVLLVQVLCVMGMAKAVGGAVGPVFLARGRADIALLWNGFALATTSVAVAAGIPFGAGGVAAGVSLNALLLLAVSEGIVHRLVPLGFRAYLAAQAPALLAAACAGVAAGCGVVLIRPHLSPAAVLIAGAAFGAALYGALVWTFQRKAVSEMAEFIRAWRGDEAEGRKGDPA
jgi:O-antigen/teichoic acid export membrane protein